MQEQLNHMINVFNENQEQFMKIKETSIDWFILYIDGVEITQGDTIDIYDRVNRIIRENGLQWGV